jgi:hypothetical protein
MKKTFLLLIYIISISAFKCYDEPQICNNLVTQEDNTNCFLTRICISECSLKYRYEIDICIDQKNTQSKLHDCYAKYFNRYIFPCEKRCDTDKYYANKSYMEYKQRLTSF